MRNFLGEIIRVLTDEVGGIIMGHDVEADSAEEVDHFGGVSEVGGLPSAE